MIRTAPLWASAYPKRHWRDDRRTLTHAVEFDEAGNPGRALCKSIQPESVCSDDTQINEEPPSCPRCRKRWDRLKQTNPERFSMSQPYAFVICQGVDPSICPPCGSQPLTEEQYSQQMSDPWAKWKCPLCHGPAEFDDDKFEELHPEQA